MGQTDANILRIPYEDAMADAAFKITRPWQLLFRQIKSLLDPMGLEQSFEIVNNQASAADITGMSLNKEQVSSAIVEYLIQRVTTGGGAVELIAGGMFHLVYKPTSDSWAIQAIGTPGPSSSGVTFSVTSAGQVQYTSTNETGTASISKIYFRMRTFGGKNSQYSKAGAK